MRILIVASRFPYPPWRGNQFRPSEGLAALGGHDLVLVCPGPGSLDDAHRLRDEGVESVVYASGGADRVAGLLGAVAGGLPFQESLYATSAARRAVVRAVTEAPPDVAVIQMVRCGWAVDAIRTVASDVPFVFDAIDAMGLHFERAAGHVRPELRPAYRIEAGRCRRRERSLAQAAAVTTAVSGRDLEALRPVSGCVVPVAGRHVVVRQPEAKVPSVLLSGNLGYRPTVQGALWFAREVWPAVRAGVPEARWVLAGARPAAAIRRLERIPGVEVHADVPELADYLGRASLSIAPMKEGSGVPMKVLEAWAAGVPVIAHPWTAEGLEPDTREALVIAEDPARWIAEITHLLTDETAAIPRAELGRSAWTRWYRPERIAGLIRDVVERAEARQ